MLLKVVVEVSVVIVKKPRELVHLDLRDTRTRGAQNQVSAAGLSYVSYSQAVENSYTERYSAWIVITTVDCSLTQGAPAEGLVHRRPQPGAQNTHAQSSPTASFPSTAPRVPWLLESKDLSCGNTSHILL